MTTHNDPRPTYDLLAIKLAEAIAALESERATTADRIRAALRVLQKQEPPQGDALEVLEAVTRQVAEDFDHETRLLESERAAHAETKAELAGERDWYAACCKAERELGAARKCIDAVRAEATGPGTIGQFLAAALAAFEEYDAASTPPPPAQPAARVEPGWDTKACELCLGDGYALSGATCLECHGSGRVPIVDAGEGGGSEG